jgi:hypothetical protein
MSFTKSRKGQQSGSAAAGLVGFITLLIVFYIIFLPPEYRAELLGESYPGSGSSGSGSSGSESDVTGDVIFSTTPGTIDYQRLDTYEYDIPSFSLFHSEEAKVISRSSNMIVKNGWFDQKNQNISFYVTDTEMLSQVELTITLNEFYGDLLVNLNGKDIFNYPAYSANPEPIPINTIDLVKGKNIIEFSVSDVGLRFWTTNKYVIQEAKITAIESDPSRSQSISQFYIAPDQGEKIEKATLKFFPDCSPNNVGYLHVYLNDRKVFSGVPDCGLLNSYDLSPSMLIIGKNKLSMKTDKGNYLIDRISLKTFLEEPIHPTYYFDLEPDLFKKEHENINRCGDIDGFCPENCDEDTDKDCCFEEYIDGYWCDIKTDLLDDRCVGFVDEESCGRCRSGYEDKRGNAPEKCKGLCGDDKDGKCPACCSILWDKDCCFELSGHQYWCEDLPTNGADFTCLSSMKFDLCKFCKSGYKGESTNPTCTYEDDDYIEKNALRSGVHIIVEFKFTERGDNKEAIFYVNGHKHGFDTREDTYTKQIDLDVEPGTNSIRLIPKSNLDIRDLVIKIKE